MSKQTKKFIENIKVGQPPSLLEQVKEAAGAAKALGGQLWDGLKPMFDHGRTELAAAIFSGHAHVLYMKGNDGVGQENAKENGRDLEMVDAKEKEREKESNEHQNEGREM